MRLARVLHLLISMEKMQWTPQHAKLQAIMQQEMLALRELLANLHQEEFLMAKMDPLYWDQMMEERATLFAKLTELKQNRDVAIRLLQPSHDQLPLKDLLPLTQTESWEILSLQDQILTLWDRMNLQVSRNHMLKQLQPQKKHKIEIATEALDEYDEGDAG
jgi:hypothetical protein